jgi:hypothetical protein
MAQSGRATDLHAEEITMRRRPNASRREIKARLIAEMILALADAGKLGVSQREFFRRILSELEPRLPTWFNGPLTQITRLPGRPRTWRTIDHQNLLNHLALGQVISERQGQSHVSNVEALKVVYGKLAANREWTPRQVRELAQQHAKRISDARTALRKFPKK